MALPDNSRVNKRNDMAADHKNSRDAVTPVSLPTGILKRSVFWGDAIFCFST